VVHQKVSLTLRRRTTINSHPPLGGCGASNLTAQLQHGLPIPARCSAMYAASMRYCRSCCGSFGVLKIVLCCAALLSCCKASCRSIERSSTMVLVA
jgi:hypothetical protein